MDELDQDVALPPIADGEIVQIVSIAVKALKTKPPVHYTEGTLIGTMKNASSLITEDPKLRAAFKSAAGLGTAATRASVIDELKADGLLLKKGKKLYPSEHSINMIGWLNTHAPQTVDVKMSAIWESTLSSFAKPGDGKAFEDQFRQELVALIETLKSARPLATRGTNSSTEKTMSDNKPSEKQLEFAQKIAQKLGIDVPESAVNDRAACSSFIEANREAALRPSAKQISFAENIAKNKGLVVPPDALKDGRELSKWIDENK